MATVSYQNVNYDAGNQSTLFRFGFDHDTARYGVLVDAGPGLDLASRLGESEYLSATLLTHAHQDHIASLESVLRDGAAIYASPETVTILEQLLAVDAERLGFSDPDAITARLHALDSTWTSVVQDIEVRPVPVGHAPGATGFLLRFDGTNHILVTGDFTRHDVAGNPGFDPTFGATHRAEETVATEQSDPASGGLTVGTLHLNAPTSENSRTELQAAVEMIYERVTSGSQTIVTTSALGGIHVARMPDALQREQAHSFEIRLVGKVASVYTALDSGCEHVTAVAEFETSGEHLAPGTVIIAGPEDASAGSAARLLEVANQDAGNTTVVQLRSAGTDPVEEPRLTTDTFEYSLHPSADELEAVVETIEPTQLVVNHTTDKDELDGWKADARDLETSVWAAYRSERYNLFADGSFLPPPCVSGNWTNAILRREDSRLEQTVSTETLPALGSWRVSLAREGLETETLLDGTVTSHDSERYSDTSGESIVELDAAVYRLAELAAESDTSIAHNQVVTTDLETLVVEAVDWFFAETLRDGPSRQSTALGLEQSVSVVEHSPLAHLLATASSADGTRTQVLVDLLSDRLGVPSQTTVEHTSSRLTPRLRCVAALVESDTNTFDSPSEVVQAALEATLIRTSSAD